MLKLTQWSLSSKARMYTGRFGRLLFASEREATSTIPSLLQSETTGFILILRMIQSNARNCDSQNLL